MTCAGGKSRITPTRPHPICRTCQRFTYAAYFMDHQVHYLRSAERQATMPSLFDVLEGEPA